MDPSQFPNLHSRRDFFRMGACAAVGTIAISNTIRDLRLINAALAQSGQLTDYKALVCVFLSGGNDSNNLLIPVTDTEYGNYAALRQNLALPRFDANSQLVNPITIEGESTPRYSFHPKATKLGALFAAKKCAVMCNVGPLVYPMTRAQYQANSVPRPPQLFSHSDQVTHWQTSLPDQPPRTGWGGRIADILHSQQLPNAQIQLCTSIAGANTFEVGNSVQQYQVSTSGALALSNLTGNRLTAYRDILALDDVSLQRMAYADVQEHADATTLLLGNALGLTSSPTYWSTPFPSGTLGDQLKMVARLIAARNTLSMKRQIFFVSVGGYDTHTNQTNADVTAGSHADLLLKLSEGLNSFQAAMEQLTIGDKVTSFTASDFGRTFPSNGQGSDHGWGSHHLVVGGAVKGQKLYGKYPVLQVSGPDDTSTGRWIPSTSVDEYSATLAKWFGVGPTYMSSVFPNLGRFANPDLGFLA